MTKKTSIALADVAEELQIAMAAFPVMASPHEGWAIVREEVDELWEEVKKQHNVRTKKEMRKEAMQVAVMALRFMVDLT